MRLLLDTDIVIDMLRGYPPAMVWFRERPDDITLAISGFSAFELIAGCRNQVELTRMGQLISAFEVIWLTPNECSEALNRFRRERLRHGARMVDTLVAQTALSTALPLHTFNSKHFRFIQELEINEPYRRL